MHMEHTTYTTYCVFHVHTIKGSDTGSNLTNLLTMGFHKSHIMIKKRESVTCNMLTMQLFFCNNGPWCTCWSTSVYFMLCCGKNCSAVRSVGMRLDRVQLSSGLLHDVTRFDDRCHWPGSDPGFLKCRAFVPTSQRWIRPCHWLPTVGK